MKIINGKKIKIALFKAARYSYSTTIFIIIAVLIGLLFFLYRNVYQTLGYAKEVTGLKQEVASASLDLEKFNRIVEKIKNKTAAKNLSRDLHNPFGRPRPESNLPLP